MDFINWFVSYFSGLSNVEGLWLLGLCGVVVFFMGSMAILPFAEKAEEEGEAQRLFLQQWKELEHSKQTLRELIRELNRSRVNCFSGKRGRKALSLMEEMRLLYAAVEEIEQEQRLLLSYKFI